MKIFKVLFALTLVLVTFPMFADNLFVEGTVWKCMDVSCDLERFRYDVGLVKDADSGLLRFETKWMDKELQEWYEEDGTFERYSYVKDEDNRIYVSDDSVTDWKLLYDFNLQSGEGTMIFDYSFAISMSSERYFYIKCVDIIDCPYYRNAKLMLLEAYKDDKCEGQPRRGAWIIGLGSFNGVLHNVDFDMEGGGFYLLEVVSEGETVYQLEFDSVQSLDEDNREVFEIRNGNLILKGSSTPDKWILYSLDGIIISQGFSSSQDIEIPIPMSRPCVFRYNGKSILVR